MGVSIEQWRICIGLFIRTKMKGGKCCTASHRSAKFSVLLGSMVMIMTLLFLIGKIINVDQSVVTTPEFLNWRLTTVRSLFIMFLLKRVLRILGISLNLIATMAAATVIGTLLAIGNIEANPGPFPCKICPIVPETIASSVRHQHDHCMSSNFMYYCPSPECIFTTSCFGSVNNHVSDEHRKTKHRTYPDLPSVQTPQYSCCVPDCTESAPSVWEIVQHCYTHLINEVPISKCPIPGCKSELSRPFTKKANLQVHLSQKHRSWRDEGCPKKRNLTTESVAFPAPTSGPSTSRDQVEEMDYENTVPEVESDTDPQLLNDVLVIDCIAKFYLKLYGEFFLPYNVIQEISEGLALLVNITHSRIKLILTEELRKLKVEEQQINLMRYKIMCSDLLYASHSKNIPGPTFTTDHLRKKYFENNFNFKPPIEVSLDDSSERTDKKYQYVPVRQTLETVLQDPSVQKEIDNSFQPQQARQDGIMSNYTDGQQFKSESHPRKEIHLFVFQDGFNPVINVLGSAKNKYKDLGVYFTIGNLKSTLRSKVSSKHLVMLIRESVLKAVGNNKCFKKLKEELEDLQENGIMYKGENIKVVLEFSIGDNLGQHFLGGLVQSFSGVYCCRFCNVKRKVYKKNPTVTHSLRTRLSYGHCVFQSKLTGKPVRGIKQDGCVFNTLKYFHAASHLVPCCAHDIHEGVLNWDLAGIIGKLVKSKWFSYELLNRRIKKFRCIGADAPNKPACVNVKGAKLGGHAVQNWTLLRILPFIIADKIKSTEHAAWKLYLQLKVLCEYLCAPEFSVTDIPYIKDVLLPQYFEERSQVLSKETHPVKPKHHLICHYPELSLKYGPLQPLWTLPYEQMHKMFKNVGRLSRNFKNLEHTLATRHQLNLSYLGTGPLFREELSEIGSKALSPSTHSGLVSRFIQDQHITEANWKECEALLHNGLKYKLNDFLLLSSNGPNLKAGFIRLILTRGNQVEFILETVEPTYCFSLGIYKIPLEGHSGCLQRESMERLKHPVPHPLYLFRGVQGFSLKYKLTDS